MQKVRAREKVWKGRSETDVLPDNLKRFLERFLITLLPMTTVSSLQPLVIVPADFLPDSENYPLQLE